MKKTYLMLALLGMTVMSFAQQKETALTTISGMKVKINLDSATSIATITLMGPSTKWISIGFNTSTMATNKDVITYGTTLLDQYFTSNGHVAPTTDASNDLTLVSNTVSGTTRTLVITRPFATGDAKDYAFAYSLTSLNIVWGIGPSTTVTSQHSTFGIKTLTFSTVLGTEDYTTLDAVSIAPNPSSGLFNLTKNNLTQVSQINIFDNNAKLLKTIVPDFSSGSSQIDLSGFSKGLYFMEISNETDQSVKKILIN